MANKICSIICLGLLVALTSCAQRERYHTQSGAAVGAAVGAGVGALAGQAIGRDTGATLLGAGIGTLLGAILGNAVDQRHQASREAAMTNKRVVYYDDHGGAVEATPGPWNQQTKCRKVATRTWDQGVLKGEKVEEICEGEKLTGEY